MADEVVTHAEVLRWLPSDVQRELVMSLSPEQRGWYTATEAEADGGRFIEVRTMCEREGRHIRTGD